MSLTITYGSWITTTGSSVNVILPTSPQAGDLHLVICCNVLDDGSLAVRNLKADLASTKDWTSYLHEESDYGVVQASSRSGRFYHTRIFYRYWQSGDPSTVRVGFDSAGINTRLSVVAVRLRPTTGYYVTTPLFVRGLSKEFSTSFLGESNQYLSYKYPASLFIGITIAKNGTNISDASLSMPGAIISSLVEDSKVSPIANFTGFVFSGSITAGEGSVLATLSLTSSTAFPGSFVIALVQEKPIEGNPLFYSYVNKEEDLLSYCMLTTTKTATINVAEVKDSFINKASTLYSTIKQEVTTNSITTNNITLFSSIEDAI